MKTKDATLKCMFRLRFTTDNRNKLRFAHFSVKEYLVSSRILQPPKPSSDFAIVEQEAHRMLTTIGLVYLIAILDSESEHNSFLRHSASNWYKHMKKIIGDNSRELECGLAMKLFSSPSDTLLVRWLSIHNPDGGAQLGSFSSSVYFSSLLGLINVTTDLIASGADVNMQGGQYGSALQAASMEGHKKIVELLLQQGADVNMQGGFYGSALQAASKGGHKEIVELLLARGADADNHFPT